MYRDLRSTVRMRAATVANAASAAPQPAAPPCRYGAPLVAAALQQLGVFDNPIDQASITPAGLPLLPLRHPAIFGRPVTIRGL